MAIGVLQFNSGRISRLKLIEHNESLVLGLQEFVIRVSCLDVVMVIMTVIVMAM